MNDFFGSFFNWKLNTPAQYFQLFAILGGAFVLLFLYIRYAKKLRTPKYAMARVNRHLKSAIDKESAVFTDVTLNIKDKTINLDHILIDSTGILLIKTFGRGLTVYGQARSDTWEICDAEERHVVENPCFKLEEAATLIQSYLSSKDIYNVTINPLSVFADNFETPVLNLGRTNCAVILKELKSFIKKRKIEKSSYPVATAIATLNDAIIK